MTAFFFKTVELQQFLKWWQGQTKEEMQFMLQQK